MDRSDSPGSEPGGPNQAVKKKPTPRTDKEAYKVWSEGNQGMGDDYAEEVVDADFARELEREVEELKSRIAELGV